MCLFNCIEWLREQLQQWQDAAAAATVAVALQHSLDLHSSNSGSSDGDYSDECDADLQHLPELSERVSRRLAVYGLIFCSACLYPATNTTVSGGSRCASGSEAKHEMLCA